MKDAANVGYMTGATGRIYIAQTKSQLGIGSFQQIYTTPANAYKKIVTHAGKEPPNGEPEWPDTLGNDYWAWDCTDGPVYLITEWVWSGESDPDA
jgi:hypothetical protein